MYKSFILAILIISAFACKEEAEKYSEFFRGVAVSDLKDVDADVSACIDDWTGAADALAKAIYYFTQGRTTQGLIQLKNLISYIPLIKADCFDSVEFDQDFISRLEADKDFDLKLEQQSENLTQNVEFIYQYMRSNHYYKCGEEVRLVFEKILATPTY